MDQVPSYVGFVFGMASTRVARSSGLGVFPHGPEASFPGACVDPFCALLFGELFLLLSIQIYSF